LAIFSSDRGAHSIDSELRAVNKTGTICGQKDNCFCDFVGRGWTVRRSLGGQLLEGLAAVGVVDRPPTRLEDLEDDEDDEELLEEDEGEEAVVEPE